MEGCGRTLLHTVIVVLDEILRQLPVQPDLEVVDPTGNPLSYKSEDEHYATLYHVWTGTFSGVFSCAALEPIVLVVPLTGVPLVVPKT